jgi:hypothetical protein
VWVERHRNILHNDEVSILTPVCESNLAGLQIIAERLLRRSTLAGSQGRKCLA